MFCWNPEEDRDEMPPEEIVAEADEIAENEREYLREKARDERMFRAQFG